MRRVLASSSPGEVRVAVTDDDSLLDYAIWRPGAPDGVGDLHRGRVIARVPAMAGVFVALHEEEGFLPDSAGGKGLSDGATIGVRIVRAAQGGKGPRLDARLDPADRALIGSGAPALLRRGPGAVERLAALHPGAPVWVDDAALAAALRPRLGDRSMIVPSVFDDTVDSAIDVLVQATVALPRGGSMHVHPTPALIAIDFDAGASTGERRAKAEAQMAFNRCALPVLARQIRLRNLSGAILVDLAGLRARRRTALAVDLRRALADDPLDPRFLGFTALGLAEIRRARVHPPLHELLSGPHASGLAALRQIARTFAACPWRAPVLRAAPAIIAALEADPVALPDLARRIGRSLILRADPTLSGWRVESE